MVARVGEFDLVWFQLIVAAAVSPAAEAAGLNRRNNIVAARGILRWAEKRKPLG